MSEEKEGFCDFRVIFYKVTIVTCESEEFADFCDVCGGKPFPYFFDFDIVHVYCPFAYSYSEELDRWLFECAFLWFEEEVVFQELREDSTNIGSVTEDVLLFSFAFSSFSVYRHVVHVDRHPAFCYFFGEDRIHHRLEGCGGVGESEEHDRGFK